ncbi:MAG: GNAT family protein [Dysgonomonas sp.]|nr:GNAT family protein [Dysgonomonas sp.]
MIIVDENIRLKEISLADVGDIFFTIDTQREYLREWLPFVDYTKEENDTRAFVQDVIDRKENNYIIQENSKFVGLIGFKEIDTANRKTEIGYWLSEKAQGKGIMTRSVKSLLKLGFGQMGLNRIQIKVAVANPKSRRIPERLGFTQEGIERDGELLVDNKFTDIVIYGLLKKEFKE